MLITTNKIIDVIDLVDNSTIALWDIDNTLLKTEDLSGSEAWFYSCFNKLNEKMDRRQALAKVVDIQALEWQRSKFTTLDKNTASTVAAIQSIAHKSFCVTARGLINCYQTVEALRENDITFSKLDSDVKLICASVYDNTPTKEPQLALNFSALAGYAHGIIFCGGHNQCDVLNMLSHSLPLKHAKKIVYTNDHKHKLLEVEKFCKQNDIKFIGVLYTKSNEFTHKAHNAISVIHKLKAKLLKNNGT